jgi:hypothetical protein
MNEHSHAIMLSGLDGANPLAFLAALGTFRMLSETKVTTQAWKMSWINDGGAWRPVLWTNDPIPYVDLVSRLHEQLQIMADHPVLTFSKNLRLSPAHHRYLANRASTERISGADGISHQFLSAFGCDGILDENGLVADTALRTMGGGGHQDFVKFMNDLAKSTSAAQVHEALFGPWNYADPTPSLRFDPLDDRRYALRWKNPSQDAIQTVRGANRLAIEGIPLLYVAPVRMKLETCGFTGHRSSNTFWTWPIWEAPISLDVCRSLLAQRELLSATNDSADQTLTQRGVVAVFRAQRITVGKFRNFTPARQIA